MQAANSGGYGPDVATTVAEGESTPRACLRLGGLLARTEQNQRRNTVLYRTPPVCWGFLNQLSSDSWAVGLRRADPCSALGCETTSGSGSRIFCPAGKAMWAAMQRTTGCSLMRFFTDTERESPGVICLRVSATGRSYTSALVDGRRAACSSEF